MTEQEFNDVYYPKYRESIERIARKYARSDNDLCEDLYQEGLLALFRCDMTTVRTNESAFVRQAVKFRMVDYLRRLKLMQHESLDTHLSHGWQLVRGTDGGLTLTQSRKQLHRQPVLYDQEYNHGDDR